MNEMVITFKHTITSKNKAQLLKLCKKARFIKKVAKCYDLQLINAIIMKRMKTV